MKLTMPPTQRDNDLNEICHKYQLKRYSSPGRVIERVRGGYQKTCNSEGGKPLQVIAERSIAVFSLGSL